MNITQLHLMNLQTRKMYIFNECIDGVEQCEEFLFRQGQDLPAGMYVIADTDVNYGVLNIEKSKSQFVVGRATTLGWENALDMNYSIDDLKDVLINGSIKISVHDQKMSDYLNFAHEAGFLDKVEVFYRRWNRVSHLETPAEVKFQWF